MYKYKIACVTTEFDGIELRSKRIKLLPTKGTPFTVHASASKSMLLPEGVFIQAGRFDIEASTPVIPFGFNTSVLLTDDTSVTLATGDEADPPPEQVTTHI